MSRDFERRVEELFDSAVRRPAEERRRWLEEHAEDPALLAEVESLLAFDAPGDTFLQGAVLRPLRAGDALAGVDGRKIGPYELLAVLGEGGMGHVYLAEQSEPLRRRVAIKIMKLGVDTQEVLARFQAERQLLALMDHPHIARVYDAGTTDDHRPYFVMEHVPGVPLTRYCSENELELSARLELFAAVCDGVQHAHQKGVIHRDLKPSNILVKMEGDEAVPKIIDFGVAKATEPLRGRSLQTRPGALIGTLEYMSPEQITGDAAAIDTRSDVYSLGVTLYELLTERLPYDVGGKPLMEAARVISDEEPRRLGSIDRALRGDLATVVAKALEKNRERRYPSASALAGDLLRYLRDEPITARPTTTMYQLHKFAKRNKVLVGSVAAVLLILMAGTLSVSLLLMRALSAEQRASARAGEATAAKAEALAARDGEKRLRLVADDRRQEAEDAREAEARQRAEAERRLRVSRAVVDFLDEDLLAQADPHLEPDREISLREVLDRAAEKIEGSFQNEPVIEAAIRMTLGRTYWGLGEMVAAERHVQRAVDLRREALGEDQRDTLESKFFRSVLHVDQGRYPEATALLEEVLEARRRVLGEEHPETLQCLSQLGELHRRRGNLEKSEEMLEESIAMHRRCLGVDHPSTVESLRYLAALYGDQDRLDEAIELQASVVELHRSSFGESHPETLASMNNLASLHAEQGHHQEAEALYLRLLELTPVVLGEDHPSLIYHRAGLAYVYEAEGRLDEAEPLHVGALELERRLFGSAHPDALQLANNLANFYRRQGRTEDAEPLLAEAVRGARESLPAGHWLIGVFLANHGATLTTLKRFAEAESANVEAVRILEAALGSDHWRTQTALDGLIDLYRVSGQPEKAAQWGPRKLPASGSDRDED